LFLIMLGRIEDTGEPNRAASIDESGRDHRCLQDPVALGNGDPGSRPYCLDSTIGSAKNDGILERLQVACHGEKQVGLDRDLGLQGGAANKEEKEESEHRFQEKNYR
jgi:hypothetical protein